MDTQFKTVYGSASTTKPTPILSADPSRDRVVILVLDDSNWIIECCTTRQAEGGGRAKIPFAGAMPPFVLKAKQELNAFASLAAGSAASQWALSVTVCDAP